MIWRQKSAIFLIIYQAVKLTWLVSYIEISLKLKRHLWRYIYYIVHSYQEAMKNLSQVYHDRPLSPGAELVYWVEYVVRTRGANLFRSPALLVPWYQKIYLELAAIILFVIISLILLCKFVWWCGKKMNLCYCWIYLIFYIYLYEYIFLCCFVLFNIYRNINNTHTFKKI